jgi:hypothetical protein
MSTLFHTQIVKFVEADLDLRLVSVREEGDVMRMTMRPSPLRILIATVFAAPALYLLYKAILDPSWLLWSLVLLFVPILVLMAALVGLVIVERSIDRSASLLIQAIRIFGFRTKESVSLPLGAAVNVESDWEDGGWQYRISVGQLPGSGFAGSTYTSSCLFGQQLASFLGYQFHDGTDPKSRTDA